MTDGSSVPLHAHAPMRAPRHGTAVPQLRCRATTAPYGHSRTKIGTDAIQLYTDCHSHQCQHVTGLSDTGSRSEHRPHQPSKHIVHAG
jgi:hypothetical protein